VLCLRLTHFAGAKPGPVWHSPAQFRSTPAQISPTFSSHLEYTHNQLLELRLFSENKTIVRLRMISTGKVLLHLRKRKAGKETDKGTDKGGSKKHVPA